MNSKKQNKDTEAPLVTYVKLSVHYRKYLQSRYGKDVVSLPLYSPLYSCIEQYLINNASLSYSCSRSCTQFVFQCPSGCLTPDGRLVSDMKPTVKEDFVPILIPGRVFRSSGIMSTSPYWQLSKDGTVEFNRLVKAEFWNECLRFIDECFNVARIQGVRMTRENAIADFMVAMDIPMSCYENLVRYEKRIRKEIVESFEKKRAWLESFNDVVMTYT